MPLRKYLFLMASIGIFAVLCYWSRPDRGGVKSCAKSFGIPSLVDLDVTPQILIPWKPFESTKYCFEISGEDFDELSEILMQTGYSKWERRGLEFGSLKLDANLIEDFVSCSKRTKRTNLYWGYSRHEGMLYAIERTH